jgi:tetratricopeptide (TPR) repeat protein
MQETSENLNIQAIELTSQGFYKEAIACFKRAIVIDKNNYLLWYNLGITYRDSGHPKDAKNALLQAYKLNDIDEELLETLSLVCFSLKENDDAFMYAMEAIDLNPMNARCWNNVGVFYFSEEKYEDAAEAFEMAISIYPQFYDALFNLRDTYLELGNKTGADECSAIMKNLKKSGTIYG